MFTTTRGDPPPPPPLIGPPSPSKLPPLRHLKTPPFFLLGGVWAEGSLFLGDFLHFPVRSKFPLNTPIPRARRRRVIVEKDCVGNCPLPPSIAFGNSLLQFVFPPQSLLPSLLASSGYRRSSTTLFRCAPRSRVYLVQVRLRLSAADRLESSFGTYFFFLGPAKQGLDRVGVPSPPR